MNVPPVAFIYASPRSTLFITLMYFTFASDAAASSASCRVPLLVRFAASAPHCASTVGSSGIGSSGAGSSEEVSSGSGVVSSGSEVVSSGSEVVSSGSEVVSSGSEVVSSGSGAGSGSGVGSTGVVRSPAM